MEQAKKTVENFLKAWKKGDYNAMHELCQKTYKVANTEQNLKSLLHQKITGFSIGEVLPGTDAMCDVKISFKIKTKAYEEKTRVLCETEPWKPSKDGEWGVNPISILKK